MAFAAVAGCAHYEAKPLIVDRAGRTLETRSLASPELRRYLTQNLGHEPAGWNFESLAWAAFYFNPGLDVARAQWESAQAATRTAAARPNPTVSLAPGYNSNPDAGVSPWFPALNFDFLVEAGKKRELRAAGARLAAESTRQAVFTAAWQVRSDLRKALLDLALAARRATALREQVQLQQRIVARLEQRLRAGAIASPEVTGARVRLVQAEVAAADAERQAPLARQRVAQTLGVPAAALAGVDLPAPSASSTLTVEQLALARRSALQSRADVLGALAHFDAAQSAFEIEIAKQRPDFHLGPGYQWDQSANKWSLAVTLELPFFNHNEGPIAEAEAKRREAAAQFTAVQAQALNEIDAALAAQQAAAAQIVQLRRVQAELTRAQTATEARVRAGGADRLESESAQLELAAADLAFREAEAQAALAAGQLEDALQVPFPNLAALAASARAHSTLPSP